MILLNLFWSFFKIGLFAIGGAYSFLPLIEREVVEKQGWLTRPEFLDVLGAVQIFPGAISIKYATYTGYKIGGILGAVAANIGNFLAPALLVMLAGAFYLKYKDLEIVKRGFAMVQLVVFAMIIAVAFQALPVKQLYSMRSLIVVALSFVLFTWTKIHPAFIILAAGAIGVLGF